MTAIKPYTILKFSSATTEEEKKLLAKFPELIDSLKFLKNIKPASDDEKKLVAEVLCYVNEFKIIEGSQLGDALRKYVLQLSTILNKAGRFADVLRMSAKKRISYFATVLDYLTALKPYYNLNYSIATTDEEKKFLAKFPVFIDSLKLLKNFKPASDEEKKLVVKILCYVNEFKIIEGSQLSNELRNYVLQLSTTLNKAGRFADVLRMSAEKRISYFTTVLDYVIAINYYQSNILLATTDEEKNFLAKFPGFIDSLKLLENFKPASDKEKKLVAKILYYLNKFEIIIDFQLGDEDRNYVLQLSSILNKAGRFADVLRMSEDKRISYFNTVLDYVFLLRPYYETKFSIATTEEEKKLLVKFPELIDSLKLLKNFEPASDEEEKLVAEILSYVNKFKIIIGSQLANELRNYVLHLSAIQNKAGRFANVSRLSEKERISFFTTVLEYVIAIKPYYRSNFLLATTQDELRAIEKFPIFIKRVMPLIDSKHRTVEEKKIIAEIFNHLNEYMGMMLSQLR